MLNKYLNILKAIRTLYLLYFRKLKVGEVWRFQTDKPEVYLDYQVLDTKQGWVLYKETCSKQQYSCAIKEFKVGMFPIKRGNYD